MVRSKHFDIVISGNGPVGCTFGLLAKKLFKSRDIAHLTRNFDICMLEKQKQDFSFPPGFPTRNFALTKSNLNFYEALLDGGAWGLFQEAGNYFRGMQIWKEHKKGIICFGEENGGYLSRSEK